MVGSKVIFLGGRSGLNKTFAPMARFFTHRFIITLRAAMDWESHQMIIKTIFLSEILDVEINIDKPEDFV